MNFLNQNLLQRNQTHQQTSAIQFLSPQWNIFDLQVCALEAPYAWWGLASSPVRLFYHRLLHISEVQWSSGYGLPFQLVGQVSCAFEQSVFWLSFLQTVTHHYFSLHQSSWKSTATRLSPSWLTPHIPLAEIPHYDCLPSHYPLLLRYASSWVWPFPLFSVAHPRC